MKLHNNQNMKLEIFEYLFIFIITFLIIPIYLALISCISVINRHSNKPENNNNEDNEDVIALKLIFILCYPILFFPYIFLFCHCLFITTFICFIIPSTRKKIIIIYEPLFQYEKDF